AFELLTNPLAVSVCADANCMFASTGSVKCGMIVGSALLVSAMVVAPIDQATMVAAVMESRRDTLRGCSRAVPQPHLTWVDQNGWPTIRPSSMTDSGVCSMP